MFPGSGHNTYNNSQQENQYPQQGYNQGPPQGAPQGYYQQGPPQGYYQQQGPPQGYNQAPSQQFEGSFSGFYGGQQSNQQQYNEPQQGQYNRPQGGPPSQNYNRPQGGPPSQNYNRPQGGPPQNQQQRGDYARPAAAPPQVSDHEIKQQVNTQSYFQSNNIGNKVQIQGPNHQLQAPSTHQQSFGVDGYNYQYSNCTGNRKALLVGINYIGTKNQLSGCINDVNNVANYLERYHGFKRENMVILTDDSNSMRTIPTGKNIRDAMRWLVKDARPNDSLFFHYSGHGGQTRDMDGDEVDGNDEVIYPMDFEQNGHIVDDEIHSTLVRPLAPGVRLTALFDSCHSGSVMDLPYMYSTKGVLKEPNLAAEAGQGLLGAFSSYMRGDTMGMIKGIGGLLSLATSGGTNKAAEEKTKQTKTSPADVIMISGCKDDQTSADAKENGVSTGAMSYSFMKVMSANDQQSYLSLLQNMRSVLSSKYTQKPQLSASHPIDTNLKFIL